MCLLLSNQIGDGAGSLEDAGALAIKSMFCADDFQSRNNLFGKFMILAT